MKNKKIALNIVSIIKNRMFLFLFFLVAFNASIMTISLIDMRHVENGESVHPGFMVAVFCHPEYSFDLFEVSEANKHYGSGCRYLPEKPHDSHETPVGVAASYEVIKTDEGEKIIQTVYKDDDRTIWSTYSASENGGITPISSRMFYFGYMFPALAMAIIMTVVINFAGSLIMYLLKKSQ